MDAVGIQVDTTDCFVLEIFLKWNILYISRKNKMFGEENKLKDCS